jgi:membrane protein YdbS with pleckstrin-like domain
VPEWLSLDDDEEIEWIGEPVPISIVGTAVLGLVLTVVLIGFLILLTLPLAWLSLKNTDYVVTNKSLYVKKGVLGTNIESVGLDKIQNTEYSQSFWGKQFDYGSIDISTAGSSGAEISFQNIENASDVRETITRLSNEYSPGSTRSTAGSEDSADATPADDGLDELVAELRATREAMERIERRLSEGSEDAAIEAENDDTATEAEIEDTGSGAENDDTATETDGPVQSSRSESPDGSDG